jgi:hypothetical protein
MQNILRNIVLTSAAVAAFATTGAMAETLNVPFSFTVAGKNCPAGTYSVEKNINGNFVTLKSQDSSRSFMWAVGPGEPLPTDAKVVLRFDELGQSHILHSIQYGRTTTPSLDKNARQPERAPMRVMQGE